MKTSIHDEAVLAAKNFKHAERRLIDALIAVDRERVFRKMGYASLFTYATQALGLSESVAYSSVAIARKAREVPELLEQIDEIGISKAKKIVPVLKPSNQKIWIERARTLPSRAIEREVAKENPKAVSERATYVSGKRLSVTLGMDESLMLKLRRAQDLVSQSKGRAVSLEETLEETTGVFLHHKDPVEKAKRVIAKKGAVDAAKTAKATRRTPASMPSRVAPATEQRVSLGNHSGKSAELVTGPVFEKVASSVRTPIPAAIEHQIRVRDAGKCQGQTPTGPCGQTRWVDLHHIKPVSQGGGNETSNLITLCRAHHQQAHAP